MIRCGKRNKQGRGSIYESCELGLVHIKSNRCGVTPEASFAKLLGANEEE